MDLLKATAADPGLGTPSRLTSGRVLGGFQPEPDDAPERIESGAAPDWGRWGELDPWETSFTPAPIRLEPSLPEITQLYTGLERMIEERRAESLVGEEARCLHGSYAVGVTSSVAGEGKTTIAWRLAASAVENSYQKVCLIDLSLGNDVLRQRAGLTAGGPGVVDLLEGFSSSLSVLSLNQTDELFLIPGGRAARNATRLARSPGIGRILAYARQIAQLVIVDLPSVTSHNVRPLSQHLDGVLMVSRAAAVPKSLVRWSLDELDPGMLLGMVLNQVEPPLTFGRKRR